MSAAYTPNGLTVYPFNASQLGVFGQSNGTPGQFMSLDPATALTQSGALAIMDGPEYTSCGGGSSDDTSTCGAPDFMVFDSNSGVSAPGLSSNSNSGVTISVVNGQASASPGNSPAAGAQVAVQCSITLVQGGQVSPTSSPFVGWMAALAIMSPTQLAFVVGPMGSMPEFANALVALGATDAGYTDGSYSTAIAVAGDQIYGPTRGSQYPTNHRQVPIWLVANQGGIGNIDWASLLLSVSIAGAAGYAAYEIWRNWPWKKP